MYENRSWHLRKDWRHQYNIKGNIHYFLLTLFLISIIIYVHTIGMLYILLFLLLSSVKAQNYYQQKQQQYPYNNYNSWSPYSQNYPSWNQGVQQSKCYIDSSFVITSGPKVSAQNGCTFLACLKVFQMSQKLGVSTRILCSFRMCA